MDNLIKKILTETKTIAVVGLSPKTDRASYGVSAYLQTKGYKIIPVYPREEYILNEKVYKNLIDIPDKIDTVLIFRKSEEVLSVVEEALKIEPKFIWMQEGIENKEAEKIANNNGIEVVMDRCMLKEHYRIMGRDER